MQRFFSRGHDFDGPSPLSRHVFSVNPLVPGEADGFRSPMEDGVWAT